MESENHSDGEKAIIMEELVRGRDFAVHLLHLLRHEESFLIISPFAEDLVNKILRSFTNTLLLLDSTNHRIYHSQDVSVTTDCSSASNIIRHKSTKDRDQGLKDKSCYGFTKRSRRRCYKRKGNIQTWIKDSPVLVDDGHAWRKYGQKMTTNAKFLRNYYRCSHKYDQGCPAMKQVQRIREKPALYRTTYHGLHTCNNIKPYNYIDPTSPSDSSSLFLSFSNINNSNSSTLPTQQHHHLFHSPSSSIPKKAHDQKEIDGLHIDHHIHVEQNQSSLSHEYGHQLSQHEHVSDVTVLSSTLDLCSSVKVESFEADDDLLLRCLDFDEFVGFGL